MAVTELKIEDTEVGTGAECQPSATVNVHYRGTLMDGTEFDSSYARGEPIEFPLDNLIQGWKEGIPGMKVGGKRTLTVPFAKAYGERGAPPSIPPRADLVFEIELLGVR
ncbi:MAG: peptidyl-prolyl cis-trans isomerase [Phycisphaeraceae bacterium]|nr:MAG: peptidyl-prolyl cis-trans isomerase [Phycisphaeraceae bacterium]